MTRAAENRSSRRRGLTGILAAAVIALITYVAFVIGQGLPLSNPYRVYTTVAPGAPLIKPGDEVRIAGRRAGTVRSVDATRAGRRLELQLDGTVGTDARATIQVRGLAGPNFVAIAPGDVGRPLARNGTVQAGATDEDLASVAAQFRRSTTAALGGTLSGYGRGLTGEGPDLNRLIADLAGATRDITPILRALRGESGDLTSIVRSLDAAAGAFAPGDGALVGFLHGAAATLDPFARSAPALGAAIDATPALEAALAQTAPLATPLLQRSVTLSRRLTPGLRALHAALPDLNALLSEGQGLEALAALGRQALPVVDRARPVLRAVGGPAASLRPLVAALGPIASYTIPYEADLVRSAQYLVSWAGNRYDQGQASGAYAVRFAPVFTCHKPRDPYPAPGKALGDKAAGC